MSNERGSGGYMGWFLFGAMLGAVGAGVRLRGAGPSRRVAGQEP